MTYIMQSAFLKPKFLVTTHTSSQITANNQNTPTVINGSEISYEPYSGSEKVIYEISFYASNIFLTQNGECFQYLKLEEYSGSNWSEINTINRKNFGSAVSSIAQYSRFYIHLRYVLPSWSGSKQIRLTTASNNSDEEIELHAIKYFDGSAVSNLFYNTNLLIYSI